MKQCTKCGKTHDKNHPHLVDNIRERGYPTNDKRYSSAHETADKAEKKRYPEGYEKLKKLDIRAGRQHELIGSNSKSGKIEVSKKVPTKLRAEVAFHEKTESDILRKGNKKDAANQRKK